jgi:hypothetical protein
MAIHTVSYIDEIVINRVGTVIYQRVTEYFEDGVPLARKVHRETLAPGTDLSGHPDNVQAVCDLVWTDEVCIAYRDRAAHPPMP